MTYCRLQDVNTPITASELITLSDRTHLYDATRYTRGLGKLQYLSFTRPDIASTVNKLSQFMHEPSDLHWEAMDHIL